VNGLAIEEHKTNRKGELFFESINPDVYRISAGNPDIISNTRIVALNGGSTEKIVIPVDIKIKEKKPLQISSKKTKKSMMRHR
jgi:hypothetical protein